MKLLKRLLKCKRGNALLLTAFGLLPVACVVGGGIDMSRAYLAKARLNQACDAAALAGRRAMTGEDINTAMPEAVKFFNFNFPQGTLQTAAFAPAITHPDIGVVKITAATSMPTSVMRIFGFNTIPISVECDATQNFDNIDITLVLDVTGSMGDNLSGEQKIASLRKAVMALYDELSSAQTQLAAQGLRLRYAVVPYSTTVNVGKLVRAVNSSYIADQWSYQSRTSIKIGKNTNTQYLRKSYDVSGFVAGNTVNVAPLIGGSTANTSWTGCIEERQTVSTITAQSGTNVSDIPSSALDLNIDMIPTSVASTKWGPQWPQVVYRPDTGSNPSAPCPVQAVRLSTITRSSLQNYVNSLTPTGNTYHDIGMIWGARFISPNGIFGTDNPSVYNDRPVNRFIIYMTDGILEPNADVYNAYGVETWDRRIAGGTAGTNLPDGNGSDLEKRHSKRFVMACSAAKAMGVSVWTIAFGLSATNELKACASNGDQVATSANSAELISKFIEIGKNIGALRLAK